MNDLDLDKLDDSARLRRLLGEFGLDRLAAEVYEALLTCGPLPRGHLLAILSRSDARLDTALAALQDRQLVSVDYDRFHPRYYATDPATAWRALRTAFEWAASDAAERRGAICAELAVVGSRLYRHHAAALEHREWDAETPEQLAQLVCEIVSSARREVLAVSKSPRLPQVATFWTVLTGRLAAGVRYRRVVDVDEVVAHGLGIVERDLREWRIDLRVLERDRLRHKYYVVDDRLVAVFHETDRPRHDVRGVGRISRKHWTVLKYARRFPEYARLAVPADFVVSVLRRVAMEALARARGGLHADEIRWLESLVELGKFSRFHQDAGWSEARCSELEARAGSLGLVRRNAEGELVFAYPITDERLRAAYGEALSARR